MPVVAEKIERVAAGGGDRGPQARGSGGGGGGRGGGGRAYHTGIWVAIAPMFMLFAAFASAYIVRRGLSDDWRAVDLPAVLWLNTLLLAASSVTLERARASLKRPLAAGAELSLRAGAELSLRAGAEFGRWWAVTAALGVAFVGGQLLAWWQLAARGVYLATNPSSSFFYLLTAAHGLHLLGGLIALGYVASRSALVAGGTQSRTVVDVSAIYWHFLGVLWVCLFLLLLLWR